MCKRNKGEEKDRDTQDLLTDLMRTGVRKLIAQALQAEVADLLASYRDQQDEQGHARVVRSGHHPPREIQTGIGPVTVQVPKVRSRQGNPVTFHSALVPPYVRKTASLEARSGPHSLDRNFWMLSEIFCGIFLFNERSRRWHDDPDGITLPLLRPKSPSRRFEEIAHWQSW